MRCYVCNKPTKADTCPECAVARAWRRDPVQPIYKFNQVVTNNSMSLALSSVFGKKAKKS